MNARAKMWYGLAILHGMIGLFVPIVGLPLSRMIVPLLLCGFQILLARQEQEVSLDE